MQATAATAVPSTTGFWDQTVSPIDGLSIKPLIELAISETRAQAAFVYRFDREDRRASVVLSLGRITVRPTLADVEFRAPAFHWDRSTPIVLHKGAAADSRFATFPEFRASAYEAVVSIPLVDQGVTVGVANFCRKEAEPWKPRDLAFLLSLSLPIGAVIAASAVKSELARTSQKLADRKILDRAKGLLQTLGWSEEESYLLMRRLSRQRRIPMREIAREVIEASKDMVPTMEPERAN